VQVTKLYTDLLNARAAVFGLHRAGFEGHLTALKGAGCRASYCPRPWLSKPGD
jgi:hypothetical protein